MLGPRGEKLRTRVQAQRKCEERGPSCARARKKAPSRERGEELPLPYQTSSFTIEPEGDEWTERVRQVG